MTARFLILAVLLTLGPFACAADIDEVRDFQVIKGSAPQNYLYFSGRGYPVIDNEALKSLGYNPDDVLVVPQSAVDTLPKGKEVFEVNLPYRLVKCAGPSIYIVIDGRRILIADLHTYLTLGFANAPVETLSPSDLRAIPLAGLKSGIIGIQIGSAPPAPPVQFEAEKVTRVIPSPAARVFVECLLKNRTKSTTSVKAVSSANQPIRPASSDQPSTAPTFGRSGH